MCRYLLVYILILEIPTYSCLTVTDDVLKYGASEYYSRNYSRLSFYFFHFYEKFLKYLHNIFLYFTTALRKV